MANEAEDDALRELLRTSRTIAVVGLSNDPMRASYGVAAYMKAAGYRIVPVNPRLLGAPVLDEPSFARLEDVPVAIPIDIVDVFRRAEDMLPVATSARPSVHRSKSSGVASAREVGFDKGKIAGRGVCLAISHYRA